MIPGIIDKTIVLDSCVDGDENRFGNLVGKDYNEFNVIYGIVKNNKCLSSDVHCRYLQDNLMEVRVHTEEKNLTKLNLPVDKSMDMKIEGSELVINITVKKEW